MELGPRKPSGSSAVNTWATLPLGQVSWRLGARNRPPALVVNGKQAETPSIITMRASSKVGATRAMRRAAWERANTLPRGQRLHPFGPGAGFARTAPAEDQPVPPVRIIHGRLLVVAGPEAEPVVFNLRPLRCVKLRQNLVCVPKRPQALQGAAQVHGGWRHRC